MKRFLFAAAFFMMSLCFADRMSAGNFGVLGGANFYTMNVKDVSSQTMTQWHAGVTYKINLPLGFHLQPTLMYNVKGAEFNAVDFSVGYLELMASAQWGIDLILFRPFLDVTPFVGYSVANNISWDGFQRMEYGLGAGIGLDLWRFQLIGRYNWNFGPLYSAARNDYNFGGVTLSLSFMF